MSASPRHHAFWPARVPHAIHVPTTSIWHNLAVSAQRYPDKAALVFFDRVTTYGELLSQTERLAAALHALGVRQGDRVLLNMQNVPQLIVAHFAILRANAVVVPVNPMNRAEELKHYIQDAQAKVALTTADLAPLLAAASNDLPAAERLSQLVVTQYRDAFDVDTAVGTPAMAAGWVDWLVPERPLPQLEGGQVHAWQPLLQTTEAPPPHVAGADDMAVLPYTSGTTGLPKGCIHPHRTLMHNTVAGSLWGQGHSEAITLAVVPMFHATGIVSMLYTTIYCASTLVLMPRWDRDVAGHLISRWKVTSWTNIPTMVIDLMSSPQFAQYDLSSLTSIGGGGAAMPQAVAQRLLDQYGLVYQEGYGLTETAAPTHANHISHPKQQCLGMPFVGTDARVVDPETLLEMPVGESGEIIVRGPQIFSGYWRNPEATQAAFVEFDGQRYFRTGDMGRMDEEGFFFITDRLKRMINASGFKVWPAEVELLMYKHPAVQEACVIASRDAYRGESPKAVVVLRADHQHTTAEDIVAWCRDNMAAYKVPREVAFVAALPKSGSGKVLWRVLQDEQDAQNARNAAVAV
ncbi:long-chain fatty acid--CoA ligase [Comamonas serinivorans]|uniref:Long-chain fatty acid--CoA ligase n=1 Tax=Comamonas serinivorans TaxID=1082851 RepID=A0A1Y0EJ67_9BURK|nr:long-chain fatty acid--CoA ligase [Comamonas serinivorans]ARU03626.1 long-chain fatty acid--CoA ligase [Comamonas serinivorans]